MIAPLSRLLKELKANDNITIEQEEMGKAAKKAAVAAAKKHGLSDAALAPWLENDGFSLQWTAEVGDFELKGGIDIPNLETVMGTWKDSFYFDDTPEDDPKRKFRPVDMYDAGYGSGQATGWVVDGSPNPKIVFHDSDLDIHPFATDLAAYLEMVVATRGALYWQQALVATRKRKGVSNEFKKGFPKLFPGFDLKALG